MASRSISLYSPLARPVRRNIFPVFSPASSRGDGLWETHRMVVSHRIVACAATKESSTATANDKKEAEPGKEAVEKPNRSAPAKAPAKSLPQLMEDDVIPSLKSTLKSQENLSQIELSFNDNRLEGSFLKKDIPYYFWAFFPDGVLTGPKGFSLSSYGSGVSTVEPFLIDEKRITARHVVFWVEKRLAAQDILPVWQDK